jgi:hypothetical protein
MFRRVEKFCAFWLVAQILLPFTAPFPICDLSDLLGTAQHHGAPLVPVAAHVDGDYACAPPLVTTAGRLRLVVVSTLDVSNVVGMAPVIVPSALGTPGGPFAAAAGGPQRSLQIQLTVLRL